MNIREFFDKDVSDREKTEILAMEGEVFDILPSLPRGYEYKLQRITSAFNSKFVLSIVKSEK